jgi:hypothetical protein
MKSAWSKRLAYIVIALGLASGVAGAVAAFRSAIPFGTASSWSSAVQGDPNATQGVWFDSNGHGYVHGQGTNVGANVDYQLDTVTYTPMAFGAVGDGSHDDTTAVQACVNKLGLTGGMCFFPQGTYKITAAITVPKIIGARIRGDSRFGTIIKQATSNTPIFDFTTCESTLFTVETMTLTYSTPQTSANSSSVGIYFDGTSGVVTNGFFNYVLRDLYFSNGYRSIAARGSVVNWGFRIEDIMYELNNTGALVYFAPVPTIAGQPNGLIQHVYARADATTENLFNLLAFTGLHLSDIEVNLGTVGGTGRGNTFFQITSSWAVVLDNIRSELATVNASNADIIDASQAWVTVRGLNVEHINVNAGFSGYGLRSVTGGQVDVDTAQFSVNTMGGGSTFFGLYGTFGTLGNYGWENGGTAGTALIYPFGGSTVVYNDQTQSSTDNGDANVTLTTTSNKTQTFNTTLTANRTITLPSSGVFAGMEFTIARTASTPGAFTLQVVDPLSSNSTTMPASAQGSVRYVARDSSTWLPVQSGLLNVNGGSSSTMAATLSSNGTPTFLTKPTFSAGLTVPAAQTATTNIIDTNSAVPLVIGNGNMTQASFNKFTAYTGTAASVPASPWIAPSLLNSWVNFGAPLENVGYFKDAAGVVHITGTVKSGTSNSAAIFTLPAGYRPANELLIAVDSNGAHCNMTVLANGTVGPNTSGSTTRMSLDGISFLAEQ